MAKRFDAYQWQVLRVEDGNDLDAIETAVRAAQAETTRPSLIVLKTHIAYGSPNKQDKSAAHGAPLGEEEVGLTKEFLGCDPNARFYVPQDVLDRCRECVSRGQADEAAWQELFQTYAQKHPDLAPSNNTFLKGSPEFQKESYEGRNIRFGVRDHAMGAIMSGMFLHGGIRPYGGTFLVFADYVRPAIRVAALMKLPLIFVFTHDSVAVGEDGPTHQPVEHLASLRAIPNVAVLRPCDANETTDAWVQALKTNDHPVVLALSRQNLPVLDRTRTNGQLARGAYFRKLFIP